MRRFVLTAPSAASRWGRGAAAALTAAVAAVLLSATGPAVADAAAGKAKAQICATCHGANGLSTTPDAPNLAGQPEIYVAAQLRAYKSGARKHEVMSVMAKPLSEADIADLAAWFASIKVTATLP